MSPVGDIGFEDIQNSEIVHCVSSMNFVVLTGKINTQNQIYQV